MLGKEQPSRNTARSGIGSGSWNTQTGFRPNFPGYPQTKTHQSPAPHIFERPQTSGPSRRGVLVRVPFSHFRGWQKTKVHFCWNLTLKFGPLKRFQSRISGAELRFFQGPPPPGYFLAFLSRDTTGVRRFGGVPKRKNLGCRPPAAGRAGTRDAAGRPPGADTCMESSQRARARPQHGQGQSLLLLGVLRVSRVRIIPAHD